MLRIGSFVRPAHPHRWASRGPAWSAFSVLLVTLGCAPPGPTVPITSVESLRHAPIVPAPPSPSLSYLQAGSRDSPRLILVHGTPGSAAGWADYLADPPPGYDVVALDRPGFGQSGPDGAVTGLADQAAAVVALFPADGRPVVLMGHSLGGPIVARVAAEHADRVAAVVLLAASVDPALEVVHPMQRLGAWWPVRALLPRSIRNANAELMALKAELEALAKALPHITAPVFIVHGSDDDLVPLANVAYLQARLGGARCVRTEILAGYNHFLPWNAADAVRRALAQALEAAC